MAVSQTSSFDFRRVASQSLGAPLIVVVLLAMMVVPLPAMALDLMFTLNITLSIIVMLAVVYVMRPLEFSMFPTVLLVATLFRLTLNVASTRVVLMRGHEGPDAAGHVIEAFGDFVVGGDYAVGLTVFMILTLINFVVITKGSGRVSEVSARFTLDAMPGRQMAIDADLNAGLLSREDAKLKREEVREEADFYGSMDGASKFVRGDAIAGLLILAINIIGGIAIGTMSHGLSFSQAAQTYTLLTIGDGLVAQVPALLLSTAVAILVTRVSRSQEMGKQLIHQLVGRPKVLGISAGILCVLGAIPGMPNLVFLTLAAVCGGLAWWMARSAVQAQSQPEAVEEAPRESEELSWNDVPNVDAVGIEVGYRLIPLVDRAQGGEVMPRIKGVRRKLSQELGFLLPAVHVRDNLELPASSYRILIHGVPMAEGEVHVDRDMALDPGGTLPPIEGVRGKDPAFGLPAIWVTRNARTSAQVQGYTVVDPATVMATHLSSVLKEQAHELLGFEEVQKLVDHLATQAPKLVEDNIPKVVPLASLARVLQGLLQERVCIRNLKVIVETLTELAPRGVDPTQMMESVRARLSRQIVQEINGLTDELPALTLNPALEQVLQEAVQNQSQALEPGLAERLQKSIAKHAERQTALGKPVVLLVAGPLRQLISRFVRQAAPGSHVLAYHEVPDSVQVRIVATVD